MLTCENWKEVQGFPGYFVSDLGRVKSIGMFNLTVAGKECKKRPSTAFDPQGILRFRLGGSSKKYLRVQMRIDGKPFDKYVHRLVLENFVSEAPSNKHQASHIDGNPKNNSVSNLIWELPKENSHRKRAHGTNLPGEKNPMAKNKETDAKFALLLYSCGAPLKFISHVTGISVQMVSLIGARKVWKDLDLGDNDYVNKNCMFFRERNKKFSYKMKGISDELIREFQDSISQPG